MKRIICTLWVMFVMAGLVSACTRSPAEEPTPVPETSATPILHTATARPPTSTPQPSPTPFIPVTGKVNVASLNMRSGPGTVHEIVEVFSQGDRTKDPWQDSRRGMGSGRNYRGRIRLDVCSAVGDRCGSGNDPGGGAGRQFIGNRPGGRQ